VTSLAEMFVSLRPDGRGFQAEADRIIRKTKTDRAGNQVGLGLSKSIGGGMRVGLGGAFKSAFGPIAAAAGAIGVGTFLKGAITQASDLGETMSKSAAVFGPANSIIEKFAATSAKSLGQTKQQAVGAAAQFGNMFNQLGIGQKQAATMSTQMVTLASDFASFHNADITEVLQAQEAAFRGEFDSIQKFVPTLNAAAVEQEGMRLKLAGSTKELTAQDKALATQSLMLKGAGKAQGDFARTSGGLANQQRILSAQFSDFKTSIGQFALPLVTKFFTFLNDRAMPVLGEIKGGITAFGAAWKFNDGEITSSGFPGFMERVGFAARQAFEYFKTNVLPRLREFGGYVKDTIIPIIGQLISDRLAKLQEAFGYVKKAISDNRPQLVQLGGAIQTVARFLIEKLIPFLGKMSSNTLPVWGRAIQGVITFVGGLVRVIGTIAGATSKAVVGAWRLFDWFFGNLLSGAAKAFGWVPNLGEKLKGAEREFREFRDNVNRSLDQIQDEPVDVKVGLAYTKALGQATKKQSFARGGMMPGYTPGRDVHRFFSATGGILDLSGGEPVLRPEAGAVLGRGWVDGINGAARSGGQGGVKKFLGGFARGGVILRSLLPGGGRLGALTSAISGSVDAVSTQVAQAIAKQLAVGRVNPGLGGAMQFARGQAGKPYIWGGVGPGGYDCSGFMSAITNVILGRRPYSRLFATGSFPTSMFARGMGAFSIGSFRGNPGHMAGTLNGVPVESRGGEGVVVGSRARGAQNRLFGGNIWHLKGFARGGFVGDPPYDLLKNRLDLRRQLGLQVFDQGGAWRPGTLGVNLSGKTETVVPDRGAVELGPDTLRAIGRLLAGAQLRVVGGPGGSSYLLWETNG